MIQKRLRSDLQTRKNRVLRANDSIFILELKGFFNFINSKPILKKLREELDLGRPVFTKDNVLGKGPNIPELETVRLKHCLGILDYCVGIEGGGFGVKAKLYTLQIVLVEFGGKGER